MVAPALLILVGVGLRAAGMTAYRFHVDEALYATHAREVAAGGDPLLLAFEVDKPPLGVYVTAVAFALLGVSEFAARIPNVLASALSLAVVWALARRLYRGHTLCRGTACRAPTAIMALLLVALSPYDVLFAPTAFAEPQVTLWVLLACRAAASDRWGWAGVFTALGLATKQTALFFLPLVIALGVICNAGVSGRGLARRLVRLALPLLIGVGLLALWDAPRGPERSFWAWGYAHNAPDRLIRAGEVAPRLAAWTGWLRTFTGSDALSLALLALSAAGLLWAVFKRPRRRETVVDLALAGFALAYLGMLWLSAFNTYDRYVHTLLPPFALLAARGVIFALDQAGLRRASSFALTGLVIGAFLAGPLAAALRGDMRIGGDKGDYDGIDAVAAFLNGQPEGTPVCDHWLGWALGFYLGRETPAHLTWLSRPDALPAHAPCYLPAPADAPVGRWLAAAKQAGFNVGRAFAARNRWGEESFVVYVVAQGAIGGSST